MLKKDMLKSVVSKVEGATQKSVEEILVAYADTIKEALVNGEEITVLGLGKFVVKENKAREVMVNPKQPELGKKMCEASKTPKFKASKEFKDCLK